MWKPPEWMELNDEGLVGFEGNFAADEPEGDSAKFAAAGATVSVDSQQVEIGFAVVEQHYDPEDHSLELLRFEQLQVDNQHHQWSLMLGN